jgi:hypothetical protein
LRTGKKPGQNVARAAPIRRETKEPLVMIRTFTLLAVVALFAAGAADAAGPFDGQWSGGSPGVRVGTRNCPPTDANGTVADGKLSGKFEVGSNSFKFGGPIAADGSVTGKWGDNPLTGKFSGDHFTGTYMSGLCGVERPVSLDRVK